MRKLVTLLVICFPAALPAQTGTQPVKQSASVNKEAQVAPAAEQKESPKVMRMSSSKDSLPLQPVPAAAVKEVPVTEPKRMSSEIGSGPK